MEAAADAVTKHSASALSDKLEQVNRNILDEASRIGDTAPSYHSLLGDPDAVRRFDDIPEGAVFADKFGRRYTKLGPGHAREDSWADDDGNWHHNRDDSRDYWEADEDELEDVDMWDAWPFYLLPG
jgi:hypothetical protein